MSIYSIQATFGRGELSPKLHSRADLDHFKMGLKACENFLVMRQGGLKRRPGTQFIGEVKDSSKPVRLIPFIFSASQAYVLEVGDYYFRVYANGGRVGSVEVATPWAAADIFALDYDQTNDVLDVVHKAYPPQRISRVSNTTWQVAGVATKDGPYLPLNATGTSMTPSATGNAVPKMTAANLPSGIASATMTQAGYDAYKVFDQDTTTAWSSGSNNPAAIEYDFATSKIIVGYSIQAADLDPARDGPAAPKTWTFEAYNGSSWVVLDSQFGQSNWSTTEMRFYSFVNVNAYTNYRLNIIQNNGYNTGIWLGGLGMVEDAGTATPISITASSVVGVNKGGGFSSADVGRTISLLGSNAIFSPFTITGFTSATVVSAVLAGAPLQTAQTTTQWKFSAWGTTPGWPAHVCTFEGRKIYARTNAQPSGVWATKSGSYGTALDFGVSVPIVSDDAISLQLADPNEIGWISEGQSMAVGTTGSARTLGRDSLQNPFLALNFRQTVVSSYGSQPVRPVKVGNSTIFASLFGRALREFVLSQDGVTYDTPDITVLSEHLFASGIVQIAYAQEPDSIIWSVNGNGELIGLTYEKNQAMAGIHRHFLPGAGGFVESVCTIPGQDRTEVWLVVRRIINGVTKRYIERLAAPFEGSFTPPSDAWYLDCALQYNGAPTTSVSGLAHLESQTVSILADGAREADTVVSGGGVALPSKRHASKITVGLAYRSRARTLPSSLSIGDGTGLGRRKKIMRAIVDLLDAGSLRIVSTASAAEELVLRAETDNLGMAPPLATGFSDVRLDSNWRNGDEIELVNDGPLPATIRSLTLSFEPEV